MKNPLPPTRKSWNQWLRREKGLALITVLSMLALITIVVLAFFSLTQSEYKASLTYSRGQDAKAFADTGLNVVMAQIRAGAERVQPNVPVIHATQPGTVRKYDVNGNFIAAYKLYSDASMIHNAPGTAAGEAQFVTTNLLPVDWNENNNLHRYADLNAPVVRARPGGTAGALQVTFPIIDPRAAVDITPDADQTPVEGFSYTNVQSTAPARNLNGVVRPEDVGNNLAALRLPMPVQWLYVLQDGSVGTLDANLQFISSDPLGQPSVANPIVGRVAFWTDDETCKININTASEPTFAGQPVYYHGRDRSWADNPPTAFEYQRFPGHPATVALSSVFYPNPQGLPGRSLDMHNRSSGDRDRILAIKNQIYRIMPRIHIGGSQGGTLTFASDDFSSPTDVATLIAIQDAITERLYPSVDELLFDQIMAGNQRAVTNATVPGQPVTLFNKETLERSGAFLTASSRASEANLFGMPKVAMWPVADENSTHPRRADRRTGYDNLIAFCNTFGNNPQNSYFFRRDRARDPNHDVNNIQRNVRLMNYLNTLLSNQVFPSRSTTNTPGNTFAAKYGADNTRQILVQIFDYVRSTNLYDGFLAPDRETTPALPVNWPNAYRQRDTREQAGEFLTFTPSIFRNSANQVNPFEDRTFPGHGQVSGAQWRTGGRVYKGFGRTVALSEVGIHFICTADGEPDRYSWRIPQRVGGTPAAPQYNIPLVADAALDATPDVSGGRTALRVSDTPFQVTNVLPVATGNVPGFPPGSITNLDVVGWGINGAYKQRYYSNYPPFPVAGSYGTVAVALPPAHPNYPRSPAAHPGFNAENWNATLDRGVPLAVNEKRIQAALHIELFCPSVGYTQLHPEYTLRIRSADISRIEVNGNAVFSTTADVVLKSNSPLYALTGQPEVGGYAALRMLIPNRRGRPIRNMPQDTGYAGSTTGDVHGDSLNFELLSTFLTVQRDQALEFTSRGGIVMELFDSHDWQGKSPVQVYRVELPPSTAIAPDLVVAPSYHVRYPNANGQIYDHPQVQAPRWWAFHQDGAINRYRGIFLPSNPTAIQGPFQANIDERGRLSAANAVPANNGMNARARGNNTQRVPGARALIYGRDRTYVDVGQVPNAQQLANKLQRIGYNTTTEMPLHFGTDSVRSLVPGRDLNPALGHGDARMIAAKVEVPISDWSPHPLYFATEVFMAHNFSNYNNSEAGFDINGNPVADPTVRDSSLHALPYSGTDRYGVGRVPDAPQTSEARRLASRYGDFDDSDPGGRIGPFINKPDEGNYSVGQFHFANNPAGFKIWRATYFRSDGFGERYAPGTRNYFTPNRMVSSPVMFGSLPTGVYPGPGSASSQPWRNLLFRPHVRYTGAFPGETDHPGQLTPPDHYLLELFWMPVVEPYAISEPLSTAGKINMNYQMFPFRHIRRATGMHAVMKDNWFHAMPESTNDFNVSRAVRTNFTNNGDTPPVFNDETVLGGNRFWHRHIVVDRFPGEPLTTPIRGTLAQFDERFEARAGVPPRMIGLFRTPSQICELHLIPSDAQGTYTGVNVNRGNLGTYNNRTTAMQQFWQAHRWTGDNTRERPYSNLYARLTTKSNVFKVHVRAQTVRKARSADPARFDPNADSVGSEYQGSYLIERYIDANDALNPLPDYAAAADPVSLPPLENFYKFRVLETKRFAP